MAAKKCSVPTEEGKPQEQPDIGQFGPLVALVNNAKDINNVQEDISNYLERIISESPLNERYAILFLYNDASYIDNVTANKIYSSLPEIEGIAQKDLLLVLFSPGGMIEPAYQIAKCCKEFASDRKFVVTIPRQAKSAATLIAMGADQIHMGRMSQLGPIDPQIDSLPALGLGHALDYLARLCKKYPESADMFAKYLSLTLNLPSLGYLERVSESAEQYAVRLLQNKPLPAGLDAATVAHTLVYSYLDHGFVIDIEEAQSILGTELVQYNTEEYKLGDTIHKFLALVTLASNYLKQHSFKIVGSVRSGIEFRKMETS